MTSIRRPGTLLLLLILRAAGAAAAVDEPPAADLGCPKELLGIWSTELPLADLFDFQLTIERPGEQSWRARVRSNAGREESVRVWRAGGRIRFQSSIAKLSFDGRLTHQGALSGFVAHGSRLTHLRLPRTADSETPTWTAEWRPLGGFAETAPIDLYVGTESAGVFAGWLFFRDRRLPALYGYGTRCEGDQLHFAEKNLGLELDGQLRRDDDLLSLTVSGPGGSFPLLFRRLEVDPMTRSTPRDPGKAAYLERAPPKIGGGWPTATPAAAGLDGSRIAELVDDVRAGKLPNTHAVLVAKDGHLVVEEYFYGHHRELRHDVRSASKTVASMLIGAAIDRGHVPGENAPVLPFFSRYRRLANWDPRKAEIDVRDLLTMSSGLHSDDSDPKAPAAESSYQAQTGQPDWMRVVLDSPMVADPGSESRYSGANPMLLGGVLEGAVDEPVEWFAHQALFGPLGIDDYQWYLDPTGKVYLGGGMHLRPRDMAKLGQLHLDGGVWNDARVLSEAWVRRSTARHARLVNVEQKNEYGYLWWHHAYRIGEVEIESIEARGNGGQYLFLIPRLEMVVVIMSGNYRDRGLLRQPERILERYLLPAASGGAGGSGAGAMDPPR